MVQVLERNGVKIKRTSREMRVEPTAVLLPATPLVVEIEHKWTTLTYTVTPTKGFEESLGADVDLTCCTIRVKKDGVTLAELPSGDRADRLAAVYPFVRRSCPQHHVTESSVSVPPALTITDEIGAVWTLGWTTADPRQSPDGEFAFPVLRDGEAVDEVASRIEKRGNKIRIFTRFGWKVWSGREFI